MKNDDREKEKVGEILQFCYPLNYYGFQIQNGWCDVYERRDPDTFALFALTFEVYIDPEFNIKINHML